MAGISGQHSPEEIPGTSQVALLPSQFSQA
jgi:hypothetical protein